MTDFTVFPGSQLFGAGQSNGYVTQLGTWLVARGGGRFYSVGPGPSFGTPTRLRARHSSVRKGGPATARTVSQGPRRGTCSGRAAVTTSPAQT